MIGERETFFVAGGTVPPGSPSYVERSADRELYEALLAGEYCYVLNSRQMGKSSLAVRTIAKLNAASARTAFVDLTRIGGATTTGEQWYAGLLLETGRALGMRSEAAVWLKEHGSLGPAQRLFSFLHERALANIEGSIVLMIDEIDAVRSLPFSTDELFAGLRQFHNGRASDPALKRLSVCLLGAALPSDLIRDARSTPFNVGRRIELRDFTKDEARAFAEGLGSPSPLVGEGERLVDRVLFWTGGHPFLTQTLCAALAAGETSPSSARGEGSRRVDEIVRERYLDARARETDTNLADVGNRLLGRGDPNVDDAARADALSLYSKLLKGGVPDDESNPSCARVKMSGVARLENGQLKIRNRIYAEVFGPAWIRENMPGQELRRQRKAFWKGALRTASVSAAVLLVVSGFALAAVKSERRAEAARREADRQRTLAESKTQEAREQRDDATRAKEAVAQTAAKLQSALIRQRLLGAEVEKERDNAKGQALLARRNADEAGRQRRKAEDQTRQVLKSQASLKAEVYDNTVQALPPLWEEGDRSEMAKTLAAMPDLGIRGWESGYWRRLSREVYATKIGFHPSNPVSNITFQPSVGDEFIRYGYDGWAERVDDRTGQAVRRLWSLPERHGADQASYRVAFSRNGRWAVRDDANGRLVLQDLLRGTTRPLSPTDQLLPAGAVSDDGTRYVTYRPGEKGADAITVWNVADGGAPLVRRPPSFGSFRALLPGGRSMLMSRRLGPQGRASLAEYNIDRDALGTIYALPDAIEPSKTPYASLVYASERTVVARIDGKVAVFDRGNPRPRLVLKPSWDPQTIVVRTCVSRDGEIMLWSGRLPRKAVSTGEIWDLRIGRLLARVTASDGVLLSADGRRVVNVGRDEIRAFDWRDTQPYRETTVLHARPGSIAVDISVASVSPPFDRLRLADGSIFATTMRSVVKTSASGSDYAEVTRALARLDRAGRVLARYPAAGEISVESWWSGNHLYIQDGGRLEVRRNTDFHLIRTFRVDRGELPFVSPDGRRAASLDRRGVLKIWEGGQLPAVSLPTRFAALRNAPGENVFTNAEFSPDGEKLLLSRADVGVEVRDSRSLRPQAFIPFGGSRAYPHWEDPNTLSWQDTSGAGSTYYDLRTGQRRTTPMFAGRLKAVSPDGRIRAETTDKHTVEIYSNRSDRRLFTLDAAVEGASLTDPRAVIVGLEFRKGAAALDVLYADGRLRTYWGDN